MELLNLKRLVLKMFNSILFIDKLPFYGFDFSNSPEDVFRYSLDLKHVGPLTSILFAELKENHFESWYPLNAHCADTKRNVYTFISYKRFT